LLNRCCGEADVDGTAFGRYRLIELIGRGGMGEVWRAYDPTMDRVVALKVLPQNFAGDQVFKERFRREARAASGLDDPHVVPFYDFGEVDGQLYVTMRLIKGRDLQTILAEGPLSPERAVGIIEQVARALHAAHEVGLVHRDVKPSNILIADPDFAYLIDFGIARAAGETGLTATGGLIGTLRYMAPERFNTGQADARSDIYSLACVLYEALTGRPPFAGDSLEQQLAGHLATPPPWPSSSSPGVPEAFDAVVATGMAKDPDQRYATTVELADAARDAVTIPIQRPAPSPAPNPPTEQAAPVTARWVAQDESSAIAPRQTPQRGRGGHSHGDGMTATGFRCGSCGTELPPDSRFCNKCGAPITPAGTAAEYKQVTVLFADVVHSMNIAAAVGAERLREIMAELVDRASAVVQRFGGRVDKFTGDGVMAVFGAPVALEDHAVRACLAALGMQDETVRLAAEVEDRDGIELHLRIGLNSGQVIAGAVGSRSLGYTTIGEQVGMAQRMESVAPPGGVMLSASTARLVEDTATLGEPEMVRIRGAEEPVVARRLLGMAERDGGVGRAESKLVGRRWEMFAAEGLLDRAIDGHGAVVGVVGPPGIGKSRLVREVVAIARRRGVEVITVFCESHTSRVPFHAVARLLRAATGVEGLGGQTARDRVRDGIPEADPEDVLLFDDMLGIADPNAPLPAIDPDARRRRLTALLNAASVARKTPVLYVIEDVHWIDEVSESMLADFSAVIPQTSSLVLVTYRPEYEGALTRVHGAQAIALGPLSDPETAALVSELLGQDPSVGPLGQTIAQRADGNPFFAEEIVRELAERDELVGETGAYVSTAELAEVAVPATLQATIAARIDRLPQEAKRTLSAASVVGSRFSLDLLTGLGIEPAVDALMAAQLIDQVRFTRLPEYVFHHQLIRAVAYESQLKSDRAELHRRLAAAIQERDPASVDENAALIAEHLEAAGDLRAAYAWHMRAATWAATRDVDAAWASWERARQAADALPADDPNRAAMRIAPRSMLCGIAARVHMHVAGDRFEELRELCTAAGDKASLAFGMAGLVMDHALQARVREASRLASEAMALIESVDDPSLTVGLSRVAIYAKCESGEWADVLRWSERVIDLAGGDPSKGNFVFGSPLALALTTRAMARYCMGRPGWRDDLRLGLDIARNADPASYTTVVGYLYLGGISFGVLTPDDSAMREIEDALRIGERSGNDVVLAYARMTLGVALVHRRTAAERERGQKLLAAVIDVFLHWGHARDALPIFDVYLARERARRGDRDEVIPLMRAAVDHLVGEGRLLGWGLPAMGVLVETLLDRGADGDVAEAEAAIEQLAAEPADEGVVMHDIWLLRLRAQLARAHGDEPAYCGYRDRYRDMATSLGFEGHMKWAEAMP
jgi:serine/threonine protein kinase/class 3 adenylate cyclase